MVNMLWHQLYGSISWHATTYFINLPSFLTCTSWTCAISCSLGWYWFQPGKCILRMAWPWQSCKMKIIWHTLQRWWKMSREINMCDFYLNCYTKNVRNLTSPHLIFLLFLKKLHIHLVVSAQNTHPDISQLTFVNGNSVAFE